MLRLPRLENALPDGAAELLPAEIKIQRDPGKQHQRRQAIELEAVAAQVAGERADHVAADKEHREEIEKAGETAAPERFLAGSSLLIGHDVPPVGRDGVHRHGSTMILVWASGLARSSKAFATPSMPTLPVTS